jgi:hypothetical protein
VFTAFAVYVNSTIIYSASPISYNNFLDAFNSSNILGYSLINDGGSRTIIRKNGFYTNDDVQVLDGDSVFNLILGMVDEGPLVIKFEDVEQPEYCPVLGIKLNYGWSGEGLRDDAKATIDKLVPELGYVPGNVFVISWRANKLKNDMTIIELENILRYMKERI